MKRITLFITILALALLTPIANQMQAGATAVAGNSPVAGPVQKPRGDELTEEFHQSYPLSPTGRVHISNINGDVHINVWDQNSVKVDAVKRAYSQQRLSEATIDVTNTEDSVKIKTNYPQNRTYGGNGDNSAASVEYTLTVPRGARLQGAELVNGSLDLEGLQGDVNASLVNGAVKAERLGGAVKLSTVNGRIAVNASGLENAKGVALNSVNGAIELVVPSGAGASVEASTIHGPITNDFGLIEEKGQYVGRNLSGQIGSGGPKVKLNNVNGSINIKRGGGMEM
ncbi:MAG TPA: DUF4097 family beta strand repeat-containing protein [Pyrinomonadaceae bacterium]|nr:DUF4097 family beta strand repeat-containing protein [Pyrinomonadaceae bacterium]